MTSKEARNAGSLDSVLVRLAQRRRLERTARGVYRIAHYPPSRLFQYREAILWAEASQGPKDIALSHETALAIYGISDANSSEVQITVPKAAWLRRERPKWIALHRENLDPLDVTLYEGLQITTAARTVIDVLHATGPHRTCPVSDSRCPAAWIHHQFRSCPLETPGQSICSRVHSECFLAQSWSFLSPTNS